MLQHQLVVARLQLQFALFRLAGHSAASPRR
jgi:hypothetical protein